MNPEEFIIKIITTYQEARVSRYADEKIHRGRSHSISSTTEDLFASYLLLNDSTIDLIYVDQPITVPGYVKSFMPDIAILRDDVVSAFIDLKMDLGYKRNGLIELCSKDQQLLFNVRGQKCVLNDGVTKERKTYLISPTAIYDIVIISGQNISKKLLEEQRAGASVYENDVKVHILTDGEHPNTYGVEPSELLDQITVDASAFSDIIKRIS